MRRGPDNDLRVARIGPRATAGAQRKLPSLDLVDLRVSVNSLVVMAMQRPARSSSSLPLASRPHVVRSRAKACV